MMSLFMVMLTTLVILTKSESLIFNNSQFLIYNKKWHEARIAQWGTNSGNVGSYEHELRHSQLWTLVPHPDHSGCYYMVNERWPRYRLADYKRTFVTYAGYRFEDQLWKFIPDGEGFYYIYNCYYTKDRIAKWGSKGHQVTVWSGEKNKT